MNERRTLALATDTALAELLTEEAKVFQRRAGHVDHLHHLADDTKRHRFSGPWTMTEAEVLAVEPDALKTWNVGTFADTRAKVTEADARLVELAVEIAELETTWADNGRWSRYFLVNNTGGHVHRERSCSTCYPTTQFVWLVELADCDEAAMVAEYGEMACTVCFPEAPALKGFGDGTSALARYSAAERQAKADAKAAKAAAKALKAITTPSGEKLRDDYSVLETERAASIRLTDFVSYGYHETPSNRPEMLAVVMRIAEALAHKHGSTIDDELAAAVKRAAKRR